MMQLQKSARAPAPSGQVIRFRSWPIKGANLSQLLCITGSPSMRRVLIHLDQVIVRSR